VAVTALVRSAADILADVAATRRHEPYRPPAIWLTTLEAARLFGVSPDTVRHWARDGRIPCEVLDNGHRRYYIGDVKAYLATRREDM
jgi:excisionase family DNA binding protein